MKKLIIAVAVISLSGCDYMPREVFEIEIKGGGFIKLACPVVPAGRSEFTYIIDGDCVVYK